MTGPLVRVEQAGLGADAQMRLVVSGVSQPDRLRAAWASSGVSVEERGGRLHATTTLVALTRAAGRCLEPDEAEALIAAGASAVSAWSEPPTSLDLPSARLDLSRPVVMGVINVTPDSFSDGGTLYPDAHPERAVRHGEALIGEGAALLDIGGESTRPGAEPVTEDEELTRVLPVVERLAGGSAVLSIDTRRPGVAQRALDAGVGLVNDVSGAAEPALLETVAEAGAGYVLMHTRGTPATMRELTEYDDVVAEVYEFLAIGIQRCEAAGIDPNRIVVDPGIGFAKTAAQSLALLRAVPQLRSLGRPVLVGASRKSFIGRVLGDADSGEAADRLEGSLAAAVLSAAGGAAILRVHDVAATARAVAVACAIAEAL
ncbi:MAG: dihydropteroate synthase [Egibacteraceae bacterium]